MNPLNLNTIKEQILPILKSAHVKRAALFGSYARGDNTENSDLDILVDLPENATLIDLVAIKQDIEEELKKKVDVVTYGGIHPRMKDSILKNQFSVL